jgi:hypothetical protein
LKIYVKEIKIKVFKFYDTFKNMDRSSQAMKEVIKQLNRKLLREYIKNIQIIFFNIVLIVYFYNNSSSTFIKSFKWDEYVQLAIIRSPCLPGLGI